MIRRISSLILVAALATSVSAADNDSALSNIEKKVDAAMKKAGVSIGGEFGSQFTNSTLKGDAVNDQRKKSEEIENTYVDLDINARPHELIGGRVVIRLQTDWRNLFSVYNSPIVSRWLSVDGNAKKMFSYNVGDFRQHYTPLTLWSPDVDIAWEPEIFAQQKQRAEYEAALGNNDRIMEGVNFNFDAQIAPICDEVHLNVLGSRLRTSGTPDFNSNYMTTFAEASNIDKYLVSGNLDLLVRKGISVGGTFMSIFDWKGTYNRPAIFDTMAKAPPLSRLADTAAQKTIIADGRIGLGTDLFVDPDVFNVKLGGEFATSINDSAYYARKDTTLIDTILKDTTISRVGLSNTKTSAPAIKATLEASVGLGGAGKITLSGAFIKNSENYRNELAQSPSFHAARILNSENDSMIYGIFSPHYTTFDALYDNVFNFAPSYYYSPITKSKTGDSTLVTQLVKVPMNKLAYSGGILTQQEMKGALANGDIDPRIAMIMPFGEATANRQGLNAKLSASLIGKGAIQAAVGFGSYKELVSSQSITERDSNIVTAAVETNVVAVPARTFMNINAGLAIDISKFGILKYPLRISGGYDLSTSKSAAVDAIVVEQTMKSAMINAGLYFQFAKHFALLGGFQQNTFTWTGFQQNIPLNKFFFMSPLTVVHEDISDVQMHYAGGIQALMGDAGSLTATIGQIVNKQTGNNFRQNQLGLTLNVKF